MVCHVFADEAGNEVVAVVVARPQVQCQRMPRFFTHFAQQFGTQLTFNELIVQALVYQ